MSKYPQSCYIVGFFVGAHPAQNVSADFTKQLFAIDTEEQFNNIKVFEVTKTPNNDGLAQLRAFRKGDLVKVQFNVRSNKTAEGKWFTNVTAWKVTAYVHQDTSDFADPDPFEDVPAAPPVSNNDALGDDLPF